VLAATGGALLGRIDNPSSAAGSGSVDASASPKAGAGQGAGSARPASTTIPRVLPTLPSDLPPNGPPPLGGDDGGGDEGGGDEGGQVLPPAGAGTPATIPAAPRTPVATDAAAAGGACGTFTDGPTVDTRWGPVQISAAFAADGSICDIQVLQYPSDHRKSVFINERALPVLHDRAIAAQSAQFDAVSGATVTSAGYRRGLQAILDGR